MELFLDFTEADTDHISIKEIVRDVVLLETEKEKPVYHRLIVPTCSCDYIRWVCHYEHIKCPDLSNELKPTRIDKNDQCQYCGYYACWNSIDIFFYESSAIPSWSQPEWYRKQEDPDWYFKYTSRYRR
jgi:hypothetical protein